MRELLLSLTATTFIGMPDNQKIFGCEPCMSVWSGEPLCFLCGAKSITIAKPLNVNGMMIRAPRNSMMLNGTHYIDDSNIITLVKNALKYI